MSLAQSMRSTAGRLIAKYGADIVYTFVIPGTYDVATGTAQASTSSVACKAVVTSAKRAFVNGAWVEQDGYIFTVAALSLSGTPAPGDTLTMDGVRFLVESVHATFAGSNPVSYDIAGSRA